MALDAQSVLRQGVGFGPLARARHGYIRSEVVARVLACVAGAVLVGAEVSGSVHGGALLSGDALAGETSVVGFVLSGAEIGGEVSGGVDNKRRNSISQKADYHVPATRRALERLYDMGIDGDTALAIGCPATDTMREIVESEPHHDSGRMLIQYHSDTRFPDQCEAEFVELMTAVDACRLWAEPVVWWPNVDAGSGRIAQVIRQRCRTYPRVVNVPSREFYTLMRQAKLCVGNSSAFVRDAGFFGTPVVLVGDRQEGRESGTNVIRVPAKAADIAGAIRAQCENGRYQPDYTYGDGWVCGRIVSALLERFPQPMKIEAEAIA